MGVILQEGFFAGDVKSNITETHTLDEIKSAAR